MIEADRQKVAWAPSAPRGFKLEHFRLAFGGTIGGPKEERCPSQTPLTPLPSEPPPLPPF